jgi:hypothetical protein
MSEEDKVVDGDYSMDTSFAQTDRQFTGKAVIYADTVTLQVLHDTLRPPPCFPYGARFSCWVAKLGAFYHLPPQFLIPFVGCIEP